MLVPFSMMKTIFSTLLKLTLTRVLVALHLKAAFQDVSRRAMLNNINLAAVFSRWYTGSTTHRMHFETSFAKISANSSVDQGCPLSPCGFAAAAIPPGHTVCVDRTPTIA